MQVKCIECIGTCWFWFI